MRMNRRTNGRMCRVVDGDTIVVRVKGKEHKIRLYGIDAPEPGQPYYREAKDYLESIVDERVGLYKMDRKKSHRRTVAIVFSGSNREESLNMQMLRSGYSHYCPVSGNLKGAEEVEKEAKRQRRGMWASGSKLEKPWDYRARTELESLPWFTGPDSTRIEELQPRQPTIPRQQKLGQRNARRQSDQPTKSGTARYIAIAVAVLLIFVFLLGVCND